MYNYGYEKKKYLEEKEKEEKIKNIRCKVKILDTLFYSCYSLWALIN